MSGAQFVREYKLLVVGEGCVGKSALTVRFTQGNFIEGYDPTIEDIYRKQIAIDDEVALLDILDTAGQEDYRAMREQYMHTVEGFILVYSITSRHSFEELFNIFRQIQRHKDMGGDAGAMVGMDRGMHSGVTDGGMNLGADGGTGVDGVQPGVEGEVVRNRATWVAPMVVVGNKCDLEFERVVYISEGRELARRFSAQFFETSAKTRINVQEVFIELVREIRKFNQGLRSRPSRTRGSKGRDQNIFEARCCTGCVVV